MKFQVGRFTCEMSLGGGGKVQTEWLPRQPKYLGRAERAQYRAGRAAFFTAQLVRDDPSTPFDQCSVGQGACGPARLR
jgi:hypothetical protein